MFFSGSALAQQRKAAQLQLWNTDFSSHEGPSETYKFRRFKSRAAPYAKSKWKRSRQSEEALGHPCQQEKFLLLSLGRVNPHITREVSKLQSKGSSIPPHTCKRPVPPSEHRPGQGQGHCAEHQPARADLRVKHPKSTVRLTVQTSFGEAEKKTYRVMIKI